MADARKFFVGGNWKMNGSRASIDTIVSFLSAGPLSPNAGEYGKVYSSRDSDYTVHTHRVKVS